ncbi:uncharacterized protein F4812DRAFT_434002 [Daldinia caldariorum]|uniref:uncharacterized protein n=1 Tax=Daldinia caldariorum TaxID=326644 RepID=UPI0020089617|nr:uncharacterized protein F4812DRAFT_434002 [Daldinia caldariorum]KAI1466418.1 hypothetical protein F4812DRAFT_434002 [Daldinia caldariorum]
MFEVPDAKRIRREELYDSTSDEEPSHDEQWDLTLREKLNAQFSGLLDLSSVTDGAAEAQQLPGSQADDADDADDANENPKDEENSEKPQEEAFTFRLFRDEEPSRKVILEPQNASMEKDGNGAFVVAKRPISYYSSGEPSPEATSRFRAAAVSADYLFQDSRVRRWGLEKPWKVTTITITTNKKIATPSGSASGNTTAGIEKKKKRPGKKRRIILRTREKVKKEREEAAKRQLIEKEEHLKDKKKRLNKLKKLKRRAKEKEKKQGMKVDAASEHNSRDSSDREE